MSFGARLKAIRKLLFRENPFIMIPIKPKGMLRPRPSTYTLAPVAALMEARLEDFKSLIGACADHFKDAEAAVETIGQNTYFHGADALLAFALMRVTRPRRIIEVGSGNSSFLLRAALGAELDLTCIDPEPRRAIETVATTIIRKSVVDVGVGDFRTLEPGDVLFIDGSHFSFNGTDATYLFLEILPSLPPGVVVHIHDIFLPFEYSDLFTQRHYNEQYVLAALLLGGNIWEPLLPVQFCHRKGLVGDGGSFWMRRAN